MKSEFDTNVETEKGHTFGIGHKYYDKVYNDANAPRGGWTEPGLYNIETFVDNIKKKNIKFGSRVNLIVEDQQKKNFPGPGYYKDNEKEGINKYGHYANSKHKNSGVHKWAKAIEKKKMKQSTPGPGAYEDQSSHDMNRKTVLTT